MRQEGTKGIRGFILSFSRYVYSYNLLHTDELCAAGTIDALVTAFKGRVNDFCSDAIKICSFENAL
jgi:hypothetical protein